MSKIDAMFVSTSTAEVICSYSEADGQGGAGDDATVTDNPFPFTFYRSFCHFQDATPLRTRTSMPSPYKSATQEEIFCCFFNLKQNSSGKSVKTRTDILFRYKKRFVCFIVPKRKGKKKYFAAKASLPPRKEKKKEKETFFFLIGCF